MARKEVTGGTKTCLARNPNACRNRARGLPSAWNRPERLPFGIFSYGFHLHALRTQGVFAEQA